MQFSIKFLNIYFISIIFTGQSTSSVIYGHDGRRAASNWKGSASYFHIRDAVPVYYWPDNHGAYTIYATVKHFIERNFFSTKYFKDIATGRSWYYLLPIFITILTVRNISFDCTFSKSFKIMNISDPNWNKLRLNWVNFIKEPSIAWLFAKNQYYAMQDVGLHIKGTELRDKSEQTARATCKTAALSHEIFEHLNEGYERPLFLQ